jgi:hypothetical protein
MRCDVIGREGGAHTEEHRLGLGAVDVLCRVLADAQLGEKEKKKKKEVMERETAHSQRTRERGGGGTV